MNIEKQKIIDLLVNNRPTLSQSSIKTYTSLLYNLYINIFKSLDIDLEKFKQQKKFLDYLKDYEPKRRKTYLSALYVLCPDCELYHYQMNDDINESNAIGRGQKRNLKENENWITQDELTNKLNELEQIANPLLEQKILTNQQFQQLQNYILLVLLSGKYFPVRRSLDYVHLKYKNYNTENDNYINLKSRSPKIVFNIYKTARTHGKQILHISNELKYILNKWIKILKQKYPDSDYLFYDSEGKQLTSSKITQRLNKIFGKKASINIIRHSFVTEKYNNMPSLNELTNNSYGMGHSLTTHLEYIKN